ncbi:MAG: hypothetical protein COW34_09250 [Armatimonadetes bacterium CG17_big_fil_post_rev_8_21_14_2_50_66_6]|nr:MAG: hypothetical protein COW34_09250 [Armatimonadetes bacterium CG17_big_fil_post_rev_8_21_14_2_50_66_6]
MEFGWGVLALLPLAALTPVSHAEEVAVDLSAWQPSNFVARDKKLVAFASALPTPSYLRDHLVELERAAPHLDGLTFKLPEGKQPEYWPPWLPAFDFTQDRQRGSLPRAVPRRPRQCRTEFVAVDLEERRR